MSYEIDEESNLGEKLYSITRCHSFLFSVDSLPRKQFEEGKITSIKKIKTNLPPLCEGGSTTIFFLEKKTQRLQGGLDFNKNFLLI